MLSFEVEWCSWFPNAIPWKSLYPRGTCFIKRDGLDTLGITTLCYDYYHSKWNSAVGFRMRSAMKEFIPEG